MGEKNRQCNNRHRTPATVTNAANPRPPELGLWIQWMLRELRLCARKLETYSEMLLGVTNYQRVLIVCENFIIDLTEHTQNCSSILGTVQS